MANQPPSRRDFLAAAAIGVAASEALPSVVRQALGFPITQPVIRIFLWFAVEDFITARQLSITNLCPPVVSLGQITALARLGWLQRDDGQHFEAHYDQPNGCYDLLWRLTDAGEDVCFKANDAVRAGLEQIVAADPYLWQNAPASSALQ